MRKKIQPLIHLLLTPIKYTTPNYTPFLLIIKKKNTGYPLPTLKLLLF